MARVVAVLLSLDRLPGTTLNRYCASSLQALQMATHAVRVGEGVPCWSSAWSRSVAAAAASDSVPGTKNPVLDARSATAGGQGTAMVLERAV